MTKKQKDPISQVLFDYGMLSRQSQRGMNILFSEYVKIIQNERIEGRTIDEKMIYLFNKRTKLDIINLKKFNQKMDKCLLMDNEGDEEESIMKIKVRVQPSTISFDTSRWESFINKQLVKKIKNEPEHFKENYPEFKLKSVFSLEESARDLAKEIALVKGRVIKGSGYELPKQKIYQELKVAYLQISNNEMTSSGGFFEKFGRKRK